jgi:hypothetical protein
MLSSIANKVLRSGATRSLAQRSLPRAAKNLATRAAQVTQRDLRFFSDGSHNDFAPKRTVVEGADEALKMIQVRTFYLLKKDD